jgi:plasmid stabilization system protein ParE
MRAELSPEAKGFIGRHSVAHPRRKPMPRGDKSKYTDKQERKAEHIEQSYESRGVPKKEAESRAWATVNKDDGGGKRAGGSGRGKSTGHPAAHKGGRIGGAASAARSPASRSATAKKAAATRKRSGVATRSGGRHE